MNNKIDNKTKITNKNDTSDDVTNRVLTAFAGGVLLLMAASYMKNGLSYASSIPFALKFVNSSIFIGIGAFIIGVLINIFQISKNKYNSATLVNGTGLMMFSALYSFSAYLMIMFGAERAIRVLYVIIPVCTILYLIYSVYPREFFMVSLLLTTTSVAIWLIAQSVGSNAMSGAAIYFLAFGLIVCAGVELLYVLTRKNGGVLKIANRKIKFFDTTTKHLFIAVTCAAAAVLLVLSFVLVAPLAYYAMFTAVGGLFVMAVYYTVKMM